MSEQFELIARERRRTGTAPVRRLRREGDVPAVLYGGGKGNLSIAINHDVLFHSLLKEEFHSAIIVINTDGNKEQAILRDVVRHPHKSAEHGEHDHAVVAVLPPKISAAAEDEAEAEAAEEAADEVDTGAADDGEAAGEKED